MSCKRHKYETKINTNTIITNVDDVDKEKR